MKCGECEKWNPILQGETYTDLFKQFKVFGKVIGRCEKGYIQPMFDYEKCVIKEQEGEK